MSPIRIDVPTPSARYPVLVGDDLLAQLPAHLAAAGFPARRVIVSSPRVWGLHGGRMPDLAGAQSPVLVPDGEQSKHLRTVLRIYDGLIGAGADRGWGVVAVGGGVIGDMAGFAAATYLRGIPVAHVPTTLLAQVDSAIGGKTGVNLPHGKNLVGAFHQPAAVFVDPSVLGTLNKREFRAGLYEVVKYGVACSHDLFARLLEGVGAIVERRDVATLLPIIEQCCRIKADIVARDEREHGPRRVLNFGHTVGHAFEAVTAYRRFRHGEAVAWGILVACEIARARDRLDARDRDACAELIERLGTRPAIDDLPCSEILRAIARDKKMVEGRLHFVLPTGIGRVEVVQDVGAGEIRAALVAVGCLDR